MTFKKRFINSFIAVAGTTALAFGGYTLANNTVFHANTGISSAKQTPAPQSLTVAGTRLTASITNSDPKDYRLDYNDANNTRHATFEMQTFADAQSATDSLNYVGNPDGTKDKLKDGKAAISQGTLGHVYTHWNQGNWSITTVTPSEAAGGQNPTQFASQVASQLSQFPLPNQNVTHGAIVLYANNNSEMANTVKWQENTRVYEVTSDQSNVAIQLSHQAN
ncbi:hypothetical protein FEZ41_10390 [Lentilactobacillus parafarraginis]|jgi:hypothetical protein|uniref:Uncharacterized protein n=2 Tax=Lentilactobacillus parafarraginis TaxID=390842 RepID=A0A0R1YJ23_9LACO|nr:hypothetical protein [Lentilactobacillus parafarraginis]KRM41877.1 hypothetical protein FD47_GL002071 [Lentilactobacillus parafarraginis DSM 18390 = JCM 14109]TLQ17990.1 hypothetical protein FEZ41_10390 [Lentilactobacillus parafarraginis]